MHPFHKFDISLQHLSIYRSNLVPQRSIHNLLPSTDTSSNSITHALQTPPPLSNIHSPKKSSLKAILDSRKRGRKILNLAPSVNSTSSARITCHRGGDIHSRRLGRADRSVARKGALPWPVHSTTSPRNVSKTRQCGRMLPSPRPQSACDNLIEKRELSGDGLPAN